MISGVVALLGLVAPSSARTTNLSEAAAKHALGTDLARAYGIRRVTATCARRNRVAFSCRWHGHAASGTYRGRALVRRMGRRTTVTLGDVSRRES
jgi:hypothetical protein